jgi:cell pole-organizing protein PopZ
MAQPAKGQEPSMEEILASIRRIIADDDGSKGQAQNPPPRSNDFSPSPPRPIPVPPRVVSPPQPTVPLPETSVEDEINALLAEREAMASQSPPPAPPPAHEPPAHIFNLSEMAASLPPLPPQSGFRTIEPEPEPEPDPVFEEVARPALRQPQSAPPPAMEAQSRSVRAPDERTLVSAATSAAVDSAFNTLAQTVLVQNGRTLEDLVREMLRPMLKSWLDDNLPGLVERLVRAEIERVSRGRG